MIFSMTGFGRSEQETDDTKIAVEIRALNKKWRLKSRKEKLAAG